MVRVCAVAVQGRGSGGPYLASAENCRDPQAKAGGKTSRNRGEVTIPVLPILDSAWPSAGEQMTRECIRIARLDFSFRDRHVFAVDAAVIVSVPELALDTERHNFLGCLS